MITRCFTLAVFILELSHCVSNAEVPLEILAGDQSQVLVTRAGTETWRSTMVIDEGNGFNIDLNEVGEGVAHEFRFFVKQATGRVTPFIARPLADNAFQIQAIGKTRVAGIDFTREDVGKSLAFPFSEEPVSVLVKDNWVAGFLSANANGTEAGVSPIPFDENGNEVWISGGEYPEDSGSVRLKASPGRGTNLILDAGRTYSFQISAVAATSEPEPPCDLKIVSPFIPTGAVKGTELNRITAFDRNPGDRFVFSLVSGDADSDNDRFAIEGTALIAASDLPVEIRDYEIRIRAEDDTGEAVEQAIELKARPFLPPARIEIDSKSIPLGARAGRRFAFLTAEDPNTNDFGDWHRFELASGEGDFDNALFATFENKLLWNGNVPEPGKDYAIRIRATDREGLFVEQAVEMFGEPLSQGTIGNDVTGRKTSRSDVTPGLYTNFSAMPADGIVDAVEIYYQGQHASRTFRMLQLRPHWSGGYDVIFDSGEISPRGIQDEPVRIPFPNGETNVMKGDIFAHSGRGIPLNIGGVSVDTGDNFFPVFVPAQGTPPVGSRITLPSASFPMSSGPWRDYAWAVDYSPTVPLRPTAIVAEPKALAAGADAGTFVSRLSATDPNPDASHRFQLVSGAGDSDNELFRVEGDVLSLLAVAPENETELQIRVEAIDRDGLSWRQSLQISVLEPRAPAAIRTESVALFAPPSADPAATRLIVDDVNSLHGDFHTLELVKGYGSEDNDRFSISGDLLIVNQGVALDRANYQVRIKATDTTNLSFETPVTVLVSRLLGNAIGPREVNGDTISGVFYSNFIEVPEPGAALGVSYWNQNAEGEFSIAQFRVSAGSDNVYNVIHSSGNIDSSALPGGGIVHVPFPSGPSRVDPGDLFGSYGNGLSYSERSEPAEGFVPVYWAPLRPTRPNIITLGSPAFRRAPQNARNYAWAVQWLPDSVRDLNPDKDGDGLPDEWEMEIFGDLGQTAMGDPDADQVANLLEFYMLTDPLLDSLSESPLIAVNAESLAQISIKYSARQLPEIENRLIIEWSPDLKSWSQSNFGGKVVSPTGDGLSLIETSLSVAPDSSVPAFLRLRAQP